MDGTARELGILNALAGALARTAELEPTLAAALAQVAALLGLETGWVWLLDEHTGEARLAAARNLPPALAHTPGAMDGGRYCYCLWTYRAGDLRGAANVNVVRCSRLADLAEGRSRGTNDLLWHASIPLYAGERKLGILNVASRERPELGEDELGLLYTVGALLSLAVERARLTAASTAAGARLGALEERNRLAREMHDTIAQSLAAIAVQLETADALAEGGARDERLAPTLRRALELTRAALDDARRSVLDLRAAPLDGRTLAEALAALARETEGAGDSLRVRAEAEGVPRSLPPAVELGLYRIAREALANVARHAGARAARVRLEGGATELRLLVEDDGVGFAPERVPPGRFGLIGMSERARLLGGRLAVDSAPGRGTRVEARVPLR